MSFNSLLNRIWRVVVVFAIAISLFFGDILLFPSIALAQPSQLAFPGNMLDPFDRDGDPANVGLEFRPDIPLETCFWVSTIGSSSYHNAFFPDQQAFYPGAAFSLEEGSYVRIKGEFPHARTMSFSAYRYDPKIDTKVGSVQQLLDRDIKPDTGSSNPFEEGGDRTVENRSYTLTFVPEEEPEELEDNTLYLGTQEFPGTGFIVVMRLYVGDKGTNTLGDITLPEATIVKADGSELTGNDICVDAKLRGTQFSGNLLFPSPAFNFENYKMERDNPERDRTWPAEDPPRFSIEWAPSYNFCVDFEKGSNLARKLCKFDPGNAAGIGGFGNSTTTYITAWIDRKYGEVLVVRGKKPKTPTTYFGDPIFHEGDLRYFTWATNGSMYNAAVTDSVFDEEMPVDENGYYTVVVSRPSYRPKKARYECGYAWVEFPPNGDGAGDIYLAELRNRWQLADENFEEAPQNQEDKEPGTEPEFMGEYFPVGEYMSPEEFDQNFECKLRPAS